MKKLKLFTFTIINFMCLSMPVFAAGTMNHADKCNALIGDFNTPGDFAYYLNIAFDVIKYVGIIFVIILTILDIIKVVTNGDKGAYKNTWNTFFQRLLYAVLLFFIPIIIKLLLSVAGIAGTCSIS